MKIQKVSRSLSLVLFITMVAGCSSLTEGVATPSRITPTLSVSSPSPTKTISLTFTPTAIDTPTPLSTLTAAPTLSIEDAHNSLLELLETNGGCQLPCLWDITPGRSNNQEAQNILMPLSSVAEVPPYFEPLKFNDNLLGAISPLYIEDDLHLNTHVVYLYGDDGIVSRISFRVLEEKVITDANGNWTSKTPIYDSPIFMKRVEYYSLAHLLSEQGIPASVMIASSSPSKNRRGAILTHIAVFYPDLGIWAEYTTLVNEKEVGDNILSCPVNAHIEMNLYPSGNPDAFYALLEQTDWSITKASYKPLEEVASMSVEEFYETFRNSTDKCIEIPINIWPAPEQ